VNLGISIGVLESGDGSMDINIENTYHYKLAGVWIVFSYEFL
jgi:hypothetical protein